MRVKRRQRTVMAGVATLAVLIAAIFIVQSNASDSPPASGGSFALLDEQEFAIPRPLPASGSSVSFSPRSNRLQELVPGVPAIDVTSAPLPTPHIPTHIPALEPGTQGASSLLTSEELLSITGTGISDNVLAWSANTTTPGPGGSTRGYGGGAGLVSPGGGSGSAGMFPGAGSSARSSVAPGESSQTASLLGERHAGTPAGTPAAPLLAFPGNAPGNALGNPSVSFTAAGAFGEHGTTPTGFTQAVSTLQTPVAVPEPASLLLLGGSLAAVLYRRRRRSAGADRARR